MVNVGAKAHGLKGKMSRDKDYGKCDVCGEPFDYGMDIVELSLQGCGQSQGYETLWPLGEIQLHQKCFKQTAPDLLLKLVKKGDSE